MKTTLVAGLRRVERIDVDEDNTIRFLGERGRIYSTPSMVNDVEYACWRLINEHLDEGESSVGTRVAVEHLGPTPLGQWVEIEITVKEVDRRAVTCEAEIRDGVTVIGRGTHTRFVIDVARYVESVENKRSEY